MSTISPSPSSSTMLAPSLYSERDALLPQSHHRSLSPRPWYHCKPRPAWLIPFALTMALSRGLTVAARVQALIQLTCAARVEHSIFPKLEPLSSSSNSTLFHALDGASSTIKGGVPQYCFQDPAVQAAAAKIQIGLLVIMGVLSALTSGWWAKWGSRVGRTRVFAINALGLAMSEMVYALLLLPHSPFRKHGPWLLLLSPIIEGFCGGWTTVQAGVNAYVSDVSLPEANSKLFSRFTGLLYVGFALGPDIAGIAIRSQPSRSLTPLFFLSTLSYLLNVFYTWAIVPESLPAIAGDQCCSASSSCTGAPRMMKAPVADNVENTPLPRPPLLCIRTIREVFLPIAVLRPRRAGAMRKDWALTFIGMAYFFYVLSLANFPVKYLYAEHAYGWDAEELGYYISTMGGIRAFNLLVFLPILMYLLKPRQHRNGRAPTARQVLQFDLTLARVQMFLDTLSHVFVLVFPSDSEPLFVLATALTSMGAGSIPAVHSTVLGYTRYRNIQAQVPENAREDVGVLFGALATLNAVGQSILGPILFGILFSRTVDVFPKSIFVASAVCAGFGWAIMCVCVRPRKRVIIHGPRKSLGEGRRRIRGRGRSALTKDIGVGSEMESIEEGQDIIV